ncbi:MAG: hypothetical protein AB1705_19675 [Verrucomicrobiota bacterium]
MILFTETKRKQLAYLAAGTVAVLVLIWYVVIGAENRVLENTRTQIEDVEARLKVARRGIQLAEGFERDLSVAKKNLQQAETQMPQGDPYRWIIKAFLNFKEPHNVEIVDFEQPRMADFDLHPPLPHKVAHFSIAGTAHYHDLGKFLAAFENHFRYMRVQRLELEPLSAGSTARAEAEKLAFKIELLTLVKPGEAAQ